jgi:3-hydroxyisobutyrate dehydrogenase-like beta-hydroxyacid dehydrogenase
MTAPMAANLLTAGHRLVVHDLRRESAVQVGGDAEGLARVRSVLEGVADTGLHGGSS